MRELSHGEKAGIDASAKTMKRSLEREGYTRCKACKKPFINHKTQKEQYYYSDEHLDNPIAFGRKRIYSDECSFDTSKRGSKWVRYGI